MGLKKISCTFDGGGTGPKFRRRRSEKERKTTTNSTRLWCKTGLSRIKSFLSFFLSFFLHFFLCFSVSLFLLYFCMSFFPSFFFVFSFHTLSLSLSLRFFVPSFSAFFLPSSFVFCLFVFLQHSSHKVSSSLLTFLNHQLAIITPLTSAASVTIIIIIPIRAPAQIRPHSVYAL